MGGVGRRQSNAGKSANAKAIEHLDVGRDAYGRRAWADAYNALSRADQTAPLDVQDLELLAMSAYLVHQDEDYLKALERAHHAYLERDESLHAVRCAFWLGLRLAFRGEMGPAGGWFARAQRLLDGVRDDCVEQGYLLLPAVERNLAPAGDRAAALRYATRAAEIGERFGDADLIACARHLQGRVLLDQGGIREGLALLDESMVAVTAGELSPLMTGLIYCSVIDACQRVCIYDRARDWTSALTQWCAAQPQIAAFTGACSVHRAEIMQMTGAWRDAMAEAQRICERCMPGPEQRAAAAAFYRLGEVHRLQGRIAAAEEAYRRASEWGHEPQPGFAQLRLIQGRREAAAAAIRRAVSATTDRLRRARLLPAHVEIMLAVGDVDEARAAGDELTEIAEQYETDVLHAMAAQARGAVALAEGDARAALGPLGRALAIWRQIEAPYEAARARVLIGLACRALGDNDGGALELDAARAVFAQLEAAPDLAHLDSLRDDPPLGRGHGMTGRELQVLRLIAAGKTNKAVADELFLSERTVERHVSNIFNKLDVSSRAAATAYAYEHNLI